MKILYLLPSLEYGGAATQATLLSRSFAGMGQVHVGTLHGAGAGLDTWPGSGVVVHSLASNRPFDPRPLWRLRRLLNALNPDCIHAWRLSAARALAWASRKFLGRCVVSQALPMDRPQPCLGRWDRWLLRRVPQIIASDSAEAAWLERSGFRPNRVTVIPPGVPIPSVARRHFGEPSGEASGKRDRRIVCVGNLHDHKGFREALRAADYLTYPFDDLHLEIMGSGPALPMLRRFREAAYHHDHLNLLGARADAAERLAAADMCWVPSLTATGRHVALEAMAAGRPVIATNLPHFREIIVDGVNGLLVPPGDKTALACRAREAFLDDDLRARLGEAARVTVRDRFGAALFIERCKTLYERATSCVFPQMPTMSRFSIAGMKPSRNNALAAALELTGRPVS